MLDAASRGRRRVAPKTGHCGGSRSRFSHNDFNERQADQVDTAREHAPKLRDALDCDDRRARRPIATGRRKMFRSSAAEVILADPEGGTQHEAIGTSAAPGGCGHCSRVRHCEPSSLTIAQPPAARQRRSPRRRWRGDAEARVAVHVRGSPSWPPPRLSEHREMTTPRRRSGRSCRTRAPRRPGLRADPASALQSVPSPCLNPFRRALRPRG
jgi:hypothetical protein